MSETIIQENSDEKFEFQFEKKIGENTKYMNHFSYVFAQNVLKPLQDKYGITDQLITIEADIPTLTNMLAGIIKDYGDLLNNAHRNLENCYAKQKNDLGLASEAADPEDVIN